MPEFTYFRSLLFGSAIYVQKFNLIGVFERQKHSRPFRKIPQLASLPFFAAFRSVCRLKIVLNFYDSCRKAAQKFFNLFLIIHFSSFLRLSSSLRTQKARRDTSATGYSSRSFARIVACCCVASAT
jgi:hypothetical protein